MKVYELLETLDIKADGDGWRIWDTTKKEFAPTGKFATAGEAEEARDKLKKSGYKSSSNNKTTKNTKPSAKNTKTSTSAYDKMMKKAGLMKDPAKAKPPGYLRKIWAKLGNTWLGKLLGAMQGLPVMKAILFIMPVYEMNRIMEVYAQAYFFNGCRYNDNPNLAYDPDIGKEGLALSRVWQAEMANARFEMSSVLATGLISFVGTAAVFFKRGRDFLKMMSVVQLFSGPYTWIGSILTFVIGVGSTAAASWTLSYLSRKTALWNGISNLLVDRLFTENKMEGWMKGVFGSYCNEGHDFSVPKTFLKESDEAEAKQEIDSVKQELLKDKKFMKVFKQLKKQAKQKAT